MGAAWTQLSGELAGTCAYLDPKDVCFYARIRKPGGFAESEANQLISNLKKDVSRRGKPEWAWKVKAVKQFARELHDMINGAIERGIPICFIPTSKLPNDPTYDPRWDMLKTELLAIDSRYRIETPISVASSKEAFHANKGSSRHPDGIVENFVWNGFSQPVNGEVIIVDDVLTTGGHFKAMKAVISSRVPGNLAVYGVFWAKHQFDEVSLDGFSIL